jgi:TolB-like protein
MNWIIPAKRRLVFSLVICLSFFAASSPGFAEQRIALSDFFVHSDNPAYNYLGKGISEMIAVELAKSPDVVLVDREKRVELMEEMEFALSGLAEDTEKQVRVGKMLAADYLVFGEIVDMAQQLLISVRVTGIESGEVVFRDTLTEKAGNYDYIAGYFAAAILDHFEVKVAASTEKKTAQKVEKDVEAVVAFSRAIEAYDRDDREAAKRELKTAKRIDPEYEAAQLYLNKLEIIAPKFRVETEFYAPTTNPAYLGFIEADTTYFWSGSSIPPPDADPDSGFQNVDGNLFKEYPKTGRAGYHFPVGERLGLGIECSFGYFDRHIHTPYTFTADGDSTSESHSEFNDLGGAATAGFGITENLSIGTALRISYSSKPRNRESTYNMVRDELRFGLSGGFVFAFSDEKYVVDMQLAYDSQDDWYLDEQQAEFLHGTLPLILETNFVASFFDNRLVTALKGIGDIYVDDRGGHALRAIPMVEYWMLPFLSVRGGYEYVHLQQSGSFTVGNGFLAGISVKFWKFTVNGNYTLRKKPSRLIPGYLIDESYLLVGLTFTPEWIMR